MSNVDGHSWALCAIKEEKAPKISTPLNKDQVPLTDSPVVVQQHNVPPQKFILLSAKVRSRFHGLVWHCKFTRSMKPVQSCLSFCEQTSIHGLLFMVFQGSHIFHKLRPVDQLRHLLVSGTGGESEEVERFFKLHRV